MLTINFRDLLLPQRGSNDQEIISRLQIKSFSLIALVLVLSSIEVKSSSVIELAYRHFCAIVYYSILLEIVWTIGMFLLIYFQESEIFVTTKLKCLEYIDSQSELQEYHRFFEHNLALKKWWKAFTSKTKTFRRVLLFCIFVLIIFKLSVVFLCAVYVFLTSRLIQAEQSLQKIHFNNTLIKTELSLNKVLPN
ncbi:MAG: hypothetical protein ACRCXZ_09080 [Patescibacteria group bacterium]